MSQLLVYDCTDCISCILNLSFGMDTVVFLHSWCIGNVLQVDRDQLDRRSQGTQWNLTPVENWLMDEGAGRALCVLADAGTGKSTISSALCNQLVGRKVKGGQPGQWEGPASAVHFLKYSDQRRLDPVLIIKSLAFQLASRWVQGKRPHIQVGMNGKKKSTHLFRTHKSVTLI